MYSKYSGALIVGEFEGDSYADVCWSVFSEKEQRGQFNRAMPYDYFGEEFKHAKKWWNKRMDENKTANPNNKIGKTKFLPVPHVVEGDSIDKNRLYSDLNSYNIKCIICLVNSKPSLELIKHMGPFSTIPIVLVIASHENIWSTNNNTDIWPGSKSAELAKHAQSDVVVRIGPTNQQQARMMLSLLHSINPGRWYMKTWTDDKDKNDLHAKDMKDQLEKHADQYGVHIGHVADHSKVSIVGLGHTKTFSNMNELLNGTYNTETDTMEELEELCILYSDGCSEWENTYEDKSRDIKRTIDGIRNFIGNWLAFNVSARAYRVVPAKKHHKLFLDTWKKVYDNRKNNPQKILHSIKEMSLKKPLGFKLKLVSPIDIRQQSIDKCYA